MSMKEQLMADLKESMKNRETLRKNVITMVRAEIKQKEVDQKTDLEDADVIDIISRQVKEKRNVLEDIEKGGRDDLVQKTNDEIEILLAYLPEQLSESEIEEKVKEILEENDFSSMKDMEPAMAKVMPELKSRADGNLVSQIVKEQLKN